MEPHTTAYPLAYLITFRCYGTWLHGDPRGSTDRFRNSYRGPHIAPSSAWHGVKTRLLKHPPVSLDVRRRAAVATAVRETCSIRAWDLHALNVRTNHVHAVVSAHKEPERVLAALKANATRLMRETSAWTESHSPWSEGGSKRYLWTATSRDRAIDYVLNGQGSDLSEP